MKKTNLFFGLLNLSVFYSFFSVSAFCEEVKTETKTEKKCGTLLSTTFNYDSEKNKAGFLDFYFLKEEFCDIGTNEENANIEIQLFDKDDKVIAKKFIFMNNFEVIESLDAKDPRKFDAKKTKLVKKPQSRTVKFSILGPKENVVKYKTFLKAGNKLLGAGAIHESK